jgi:hypothetical protein
MIKPFMCIVKYFTGNDLILDRTVKQTGIIYEMNTVDDQSNDTN